MPGDVFEEHPLGPHLDDDAPDVRPEVPGVFCPKPLAGGGEGLARVARSDEIHASTPAAAVECGNVVPDRSPIHGRVFHPGHKSGRGEGFPLDVTHSSIGGLCDVQSELETASPGT